ncbi:MAG: alpha-galactosidase, partial [Victivallales bacterium]|nr:alpha-galactosidase [Victivallales bacterium]
MKERSVGLLAFCNGRQFVLDSLNATVDGLFTVSTKSKEFNGVTLLSPMISNVSGGELVFNKAFVSVILPPGPYEAYTQYSKWSLENQGSWLPLEGRGIILNTADGRTTEGNTPYVAMRAIGCNDGIAFHVLPLGDWRIRVMTMPFSNNEPKIRVDLGISDETLAFRLAPGEQWVLPEVILQHFCNFEDSSVDLQVFLNQAFNLSQRQLPVVYNTWLDVYTDLDVERLNSQLAAAKKVGCEVFVVDAGWFGPGDGSWEAVGDWREKDKSAFYGKMNEFADKVREAGLGFGFWIEPERFSENAPVVKEHPEWFTKVRYNYRIELEIPEAYQYQKQMICSLIDKYKATYIKTDMNASLGIDDTGAAHYRYAKLFYQLVDEVRAAYPDLVIECCAS